MSNQNYTTELLAMEDVQVENFEETENEILLQVSLKRRTQVCKQCGAETDQVHDYRIRQVQVSICARSLCACCIDSGDTSARSAGNVFPKKTRSSGATCASRAESAKESWTAASAQQPERRNKEPFS